LIGFYRKLTTQRLYQEYNTEGLSLLRFDGSPIEGAIGLFTIGMSSRSQPCESDSSLKRDLKTELFMAIKENCLKEALARLSQLAAEINDFSGVRSRNLLAY